MATIKNGIGYSPLTDKVYLGKQNREKQDITNDFLAVAHAYFSENTSRIVRCGKDSNIFFNVKNDKDSIEKAIKSLTKLLTS